MNYIPNTLKSAQTFVSVLQQAKDWFATLSKPQQQNLIDDLEHGGLISPILVNLTLTSSSMERFIRPNCFMLMKKFHLKFGTKMASLWLIMDAVKVLPKWFFLIIWLRGILTMTISKILSLLNPRDRIYNVASNM